jgi:hypothetical protein
MKALFLFAVIQNYIKTSRKRNDKLVQIFVCVTSPLGSAGNVIEIINALDLKGHMPAPFNEREVAPWITDFWEVDNPALG